VYVFAPLAARVRTLASAGGDAAVLTDRYETAAELLWYGVDSQFAAALPQAAQWARWHTGAPAPRRALLVTYGAPLTADPALAHALGERFARITPEPDIVLSHANVREDMYYVVRLDEPRAK
jgi:hypothetical protein